MSRRSSTTWQNNLTSWNTAYTFDLNGNIKSLLREGAPDIDGYPTYLDNLSYTYQGNKITAIADSYGNLGFADLASTTEEYQYDANGNMIEDKNKGISQIRYNRMNLPEVITFSNGNEIHYLYDAGGSKLQKIAIPAAGGQTSTDYSGGFVYTNNSIEFFAFSEGRVRKVGANWQYQYDLKDHLGNVRATFTNDNGVSSLLQADSYYPFGYKMPGLSYQTGSENKFTYNGKELEDEFGLDWYHYGARYYDPVIGRWWVKDAAEEFSSAYNYVGNNPIIFIDPDGNLSTCIPPIPCNYVTKYVTEKLSNTWDKGIGKVTQTISDVKSFLNTKQLNISGSFEIDGGLQLALNGEGFWGAKFDIWSITITKLDYDLTIPLGLSADDFKLKFTPYLVGPDSPRYFEQGLSVSGYGYGGTYSQKWSSFESGGNRYIDSHTVAIKAKRMNMGFETGYDYENNEGFFEPLFFDLTGSASFILGIKGSATGTISDIKD